MLLIVQKPFWRKVSVLVSVIDFEEKIDLDIVDLNFKSGNGRTFYVYISPVFDQYSSK